MVDILRAIDTTNVTECGALLSEIAEVSGQKHLRSLLCIYALDDGTYRIGIAGTANHDQILAMGYAHALEHAVTHRLCAPSACCPISRR